MGDTYYTVLQGLGRIRVSGCSAEQFIHTMTTVDKGRLCLAGEAAGALVLTGEAEVIDVVVLARSGDTEFMLTTHAETREEVFSWLEAHAALADDAGPVFDGLDITDETESLLTYAVFGPQSHAVIDELASHQLDSALGAGHVALCMLDGIQAFVLAYPLLAGGYYELSVQPALAPGLKRLLLSFPEIDPMGLEPFKARRRESCTWFDEAAKAAYCHADAAGLEALIRTPYDFVGGRALTSRHS